MDAPIPHPSPSCPKTVSQNHQPDNPKISPSSSYKIIPARSPEHIQTTTSLFTAYTTALGIDLTFQNFSTEISSMPGKYAPPDGELLLAFDNTSNNVLGCVGLRPLTPSLPTPSPSRSSRGSDAPKRYCEMKRLYVTPAARKRGVGRALVNALIDVARSKGYDEMRLDTLDDMHAPIAVYKGVGFVEIGPYYKTPLEEKTVFLGLEL